MSYNILKFLSSITICSRLSYTDWKTTISKTAIKIFVLILDAAILDAYFLGGNLQKSSIRNNSAFIPAPVSAVAAFANRASIS